MEENLYKKIAMDFKDVNKSEKTAELKIKTKKILISISVNPWNSETLVSLFLDRKPTINNRVAVSGEGIMGSFVGNEIIDELNGDFYFIPDSIDYKIGNRVDYRDLGKKVSLYFVSWGES